MGRIQRRQTQKEDPFTLVFRNLYKSESSLICLGTDQKLQSKGREIGSQFKKTLKSQINPIPAMPEVWKRPTISCIAKALRTELRFNPLSESQTNPYVAHEQDNSKATLQRL